MRIEAVGAALIKLERRRSVDKVLELTKVRRNPILSADPDYQRAFIGHYRMGRKSDSFYRHFFSILGQAASPPTPPLKTILQELYNKTEERHLSFCTKMRATVTDAAVIFDRNVASHFGVSSNPLPKQDWLAEALRRYGGIRRGIHSFTQVSEWQQMRILFDQKFPNAVHFSDIRKADLIIWAAYAP